MELPQAQRRIRLERLLGQILKPVYLTPVTRNRSVAEDWLNRFEGAGVDGVIAKPETATYQPGKRTMLKIKHARTADCVVAGFRWYRGVEGRTCPGRRCGSSRVCEVQYDHMQGDRFRHAAVFVHWRPDRAPQDCRYDQLEVTTPLELSEVFSAGSKKS